MAALLVTISVVKKSNIENLDYLITKNREPTRVDSLFFCVLQEFWYYFLIDHILLHANITFRLPAFHHLFRISLTDTTELYQVVG